MGKLHGKIGGLDAFLQPEFTDPDLPFGTVLTGVAACLRRQMRPPLDVTRVCGFKVAEDAAFFAVEYMMNEREGVPRPPKPEWLRMVPADDPGMLALLARMTRFPRYRRYAFYGRESVYSAADRVAAVLNEEDGGQLQPIAIQPETVRRRWIVSERPRFLERDRLRDTEPPGAPPNVDSELGFLDEQAVFDPVVNQFFATCWKWISPRIWDNFWRLRLRQSVPRKWIVRGDVDPLAVLDILGCGDFAIDFADESQRSFLDAAWTALLDKGWGIWEEIGKGMSLAREPDAFVMRILGRLVAKAVVMRRQIKSPFVPAESFYDRILEKGDAQWKKEFRDGVADVMPWEWFQRYPYRRHLPAARRDTFKIFSENAGHLN
jgi:hypothetical protein